MSEAQQAIRLHHRGQPVAQRLASLLREVDGHISTHGHIDRHGQRIKHQIRAAPLDHGQRLGAKSDPSALIGLEPVPGPVG